LRKAHFKLGDDINTYQTTSKLQNQEVEKGARSCSVLDADAKNDLRRNHFNYGNSKPTFETTFRTEFDNKFNLLPKNNIDSKSVEKMLRSHNYEFGDDKPDYLSETALRYQKPKVDPNSHLDNKISNQLLQKSNYKFGTDTEPWNTTQKRSYTPKYLENDQGVDNELTKTNFVLGDSKPDYISINNQTYKQYPFQYKPVDPNLINDLRSHHYNLGNKNPEYNEFQTQNQIDFKDPSIYRNNFNPTIDNNSLRRGNWKLGDASPSEIYITTYNTIHTPKKIEVKPNIDKNILRKNAFELIGNYPMSYKSDYRDNFVPMKKNFDEQKRINDIKKKIRQSNFNFGSDPTDYTTTSKYTYKFEPNEARKSCSKLGKDVIRDLQSTHYKLGYDNDVGISTQKKDFIPYGINEVEKNQFSGKNNFNIGDNNIFGGISIYKSDYCEKKIPDNDNDCLC